MEKILVVEDELIVARDIKKTLERNGYKVMGVARSTEKALQMVEEGQPTLVLVDIFLKGNLTGIDLANELNKKAIPFIYISANSNKPVLEAAKSTNCISILDLHMRMRSSVVLNLSFPDQVIRRRLNIDPFGKTSSPMLLRRSRRRSI